MSLLPCGPIQPVYDCASETTRYCGPSKESPGPHKIPALAVYHCCVPKWPHTPLGLLQKLHPWHTLSRIPIFLHDETKDGHRPWVSCCPFCAYTIQNDLAYLNHIISMHYHTNFMCGTCLSAITMSGQQMKRHLSECPGLATLPKKSSQESAHGGHSPKKSAMGVWTRKVIIPGSHNQPKQHPRKTLKPVIGVWLAWPVQVRRAQLDPRNVIWW